jgi:hypothetical protein
MSPIDNGQRFHQTAAIATGSAVATETPAATQSVYLTDVSGSSDTAGATLTIKDGSTTIWEEIIGDTMPYEHAFAVPLKGTIATAMTVTVTGTTACFANFAGVLL